MPHGHKLTSQGLVGFTHQDDKKIKDKQRRHAEEEDPQDQEMPKKPKTARQIDTEPQKDREDKDPEEKENKDQTSQKTRPRSTSHPVSNFTSSGPQEPDTLAIIP